MIQRMAQIATDDDLIALEAPIRPGVFRWYAVPLLFFQMLM